MWRPLRRELRLWGQAAWRALIGLLSRNDLTHAASIAYYSLLSLFPFLLLLLSILGFVTADEGDRARVLGFIFRYFPTRLDFMTDQLDAFRADSIRIGVAGGLGLVWASLGFFGAVTSAVNEAWGVEKQRSFLKHRMVSFLMLVAAGLVMVIGLLLVTTIQVAEASWFGVMLSRFHWLQAAQTWMFRYAATIILIRLIEAFKIIDLPNVLTGGGPGLATESMTLHSFISWRAQDLGSSAAVGYMLLFISTIACVSFFNFVVRPARRFEA